MAVIKCKMCGGDLVLTEGSLVAECAYCGSLQTVPNADNEKKITLFKRANRLRAGCEFDKAFGVYELILADFPEEAEAYWGLILCKFGIEYVDDPASGRKIPTCHRSSYDSILEDPDYAQTLKHADPVSRTVYEAEAQQIEELRKRILEVSVKESPYDVFICYKETGEDGQRTIDSVLAQDIYDSLTAKNYRVFFARITLEDRLGQEYEPYIFAALNSAKVMLVVGTQFEHFDAVWVRNEWSRYLKLMEQDKAKHLIPCYKDIDPYDMPKEFSKLQAQDMDKIGAIQDLLRGIEKLLNPTGKQTAQKFTANVSPQLTKGNQALENGEWALATDRFNLALVADAECAEAYIGKLMAKCKVKTKDGLLKSNKFWFKFSEYKEALAYSDATLKEELLTYVRKVKRRNYIRRTTVFTTIVASITALFIGAVLYSNSLYQPIVSGLYAGNISPETAMQRLEQISWIKRTDNTTRYLLSTMIDGVYPEYAYIAELEIPEGVTTIGVDLFKRSEFITSVTIPDSVTTIGNSAFANCTKLVKVTIPDSVTSIGNRAFVGCMSLYKISIPSSVTSIGKNAFEDCTKLGEISIPDGVTTIDNGVFYGCKALTNISIPDSVTTIGGSAFMNCSGLTEITIPDSVTTIGSSAFMNCSGLTEITIPDGVTAIGNSAFQNCSMLTDISIPNSVTKIGSRAFQKCTALNSLNIPKSVTSVGEMIVYGSPTEVTCEATERPEDWAKNWIITTESPEVVWGYTG